MPNFLIHDRLTNQIINASGEDFYLAAFPIASTTDRRGPAIPVSEADVKYRWAVYFDTPALAKALEAVTGDDVPHVLEENGSLAGRVATAVPFIEGQG